MPYPTTPPVILMPNNYYSQPYRYERRVTPDPIPGQSNVYDRDGHRKGTLETQPDGSTIYRDFQSGQRR